MRGTNYMLLGIAIMLLGHGFLHLFPWLYLLLGIVGFCMVLHGFGLSREKKVNCDKRMIGMVRTIPSEHFIEVNKAQYDKKIQKYTYDNESYLKYCISPECVIEMNARNHWTMAYDEWKKMNEETLSEEKLYCIGMKDDKVVYLEQIDQKIILSNDAE